MAQLAHELVELNLAKLIGSGAKLESETFQLGLAMGAARVRAKLVKDPNWTKVVVDTSHLTNGVAHDCKMFELIFFYRSPITISTVFPRYFLHFSSHFWFDSMFSSPSNNEVLWYCIMY